MIYNQEFYTEFIRGILSRVPLLRTQQLTNALLNIDGNMTPEVAWAVLYNIQRNNYVLLSQSGWAMTLPMYRTLTHDKYQNGIEPKSDFKIPDLLPVYGNDGSEALRHGAPDALLLDLPGGNKRLSIIKSMWVTVDMLPASDEFITDGNPWDVMFTTHPSAESGKTPKLYEVIYISEKREDMLCRMMRDMKPIDDEELQKPILRIAIMENANHAFKVPYIGFSHICALDPESEKGYHVVEKRSLEERWSNPNEL